VDANTLDPAFTNSVPEGNILINVMDTLVRLDDKEQLEPDLAVSWKNLNPTTWEFKLRQGVKFQDGEPFNADAVKYTFDRLLDPKLKSPNSTLKQLDYAGVKIVDPYTIDIMTKTPQPLVPYYLANGNGGFIVAPQYYSSHDEAYLATHPVGTGPYKFVSWVKNQAVTLQKWSGYWGTPAKIDTVIFKPEPEAATQMDALKTGAADITTVLTPDQLKTVNSFPNATVKGFQSGRDIYIGISTQRPYLSDVRVRQAMNYAVNWDDIKNSLLGGYGSRMATVVVGHDVDPNAKPYPYDPAKAKQLLAEANFPMSQKLILDTPIGRYTDDEQIAQVVGSDLQAVGLQVTVKPITWSVYAGEMVTQDKMDDLWLLGLGSSYTAQQNLNYVNPAFFLNITHWNDPTFVKEFTQLSQTFDPAQRQKLAYSLQELVNEQAPWIFLWQQWEFYGVNKALNYTPRSDEEIPLWNVSWNSNS
jgi:peptide/nickel transport system substrate-binding protein